jgi:iron complex outermembrane receptor protein
MHFSMVLKARKFLTPVVLVSALHAGIALAETPRVENVIVTASRQERPWLTTPAAASVVSADEQLPGLRIDSAELLQGLPGLQVDSRSNYAQDTRLVLRGFGARSAFGVRGMDVRVDNIPLAMPDGQAQLGSVLLDEIASVEVLRGPLATLYGNGAGGVIRLQTRVPQEDALRASASAGSFDSQRGAVSGTLRRGAWGLRAQASRLESDGFRPHSAVERRQAGAQLYYEGDDDLQVTVRFDMSRDPETQDPSGLTPEQWRENPEQVHPRILAFNTRKQLNHRQFSVNVDKAVTTGAWQVSAWKGRREVDQWLPFAGDDITSSGAVIDLQRDFSGLQGSYRHDTQFAGAPLAATLGASLERMEDLRRGYVNDLGTTGELRRDEVGTVDSADVFSLAEWQPSSRLTVLGGLRHSRSDFSVDDNFIVSGNPDDSGNVDFAETSGAIGINYQLNAHWAAFGSVGRGFETPTLTEMAYRNDGTGLNMGLEPSRNTQTEAGLRFSAGADLRGAVTAFNVESHDELVVDRSIGGRTTYHNAAATRRYGLELEGDWQLQADLFLRGSATWISAEYTEGEWAGNRLPGVARSQAYALLRWLPWQHPRVSLDLASRYRSSVATSDANEVEAPDYVTFDVALSAEHQWRDVELESWIRLGNITDKTYVGSVIVNQGSGRAFEPAPGRSLTAGISFQF